MSPFDTVFGWFSFLLASIPVLAAPWLFGAWERWWFWPFAVCIFAAMFFFSLRIVSGGQTARSPSPEGNRLAWRGVLGFLPFLVYAFTRTLQAEVFMDAERSFLLFLTPFLLSVVIVFGCTATQLKVLYTLVVIDLYCLALYGIVNHQLTNSRKVLWVTTEYVQYSGRATGSYFCPDHFSGIAELLFAVALGLLLGRGAAGLPALRPACPRAWSGAGREQAGLPQPGRMIRQAAWKIFAFPLILAALWGVWISRSRGGGLTVIVVFLFALIWGLAHLRAPVRWAWRIIAVLILAAGLIAAWNSDSPYIDRFKQCIAWERIRNKSFEEAKTELMWTLRTDIRYNMYSGALRAWQTRPWLGIGPGMHQHLWPHFAASPDGDREHGKWPSQPNISFHSYEVHSDWLQLLEEYGLVGFALFLAAAGSAFAVLLAGLRRRIAHPVVLGGALSLVAMAFHSFGDFNLQMPATTWLLAAIVSIAFGNVVRAAPAGSRRAVT